jgi:hypothetical protein
VSPVKYELEVYIPEDGILHSHRRQYIESYIAHVLLYLIVFLLPPVTKGRMICDNYLNCNLRTHSHDFSLLQIYLRSQFFFTHIKIDDFITLMTFWMPLGHFYCHLFNTLQFLELEGR